MITRKVVIVSGFKEPAETMSVGWPKHEVTCHLTRYRVGCIAVLLDMDPLWADTEHELRFARDRPGFLEEKVNIPFRRITGKEGRDSCFQFQPFVDCSRFDRKVWREGCCTSGHIPACSRTDFKNGCRVFLFCCLF